jgi:hypothetical protein
VKSDSSENSQRSDDTVKRFRCKAHKYEGMRRTYWYAGLAALPALSARELSQAMSEDAVQRSRWTFYEVLNLFEKNLFNISLVLIGLLLLPSQLRGARCRAPDLPPFRKVLPGGHYSARQPDFPIENCTPRSGELKKPEVPARRVILPACSTPS